MKKPIFGVSWLTVSVTSMFQVLDQYFYGKGNFSFNTSLQVACEMALKKDKRLTPRNWLAKKAHNVDWMLEDVEFYDGNVEDFFFVCIFFSVQKIKFAKKFSLIYKS